MNWNVVTFSQLTTDSLYELLTLRTDIFVVEQACAYPELDGKDRHPQTLHVLGTDDEGRLLAYSRLLAPGLSYLQASIGRVAVAKAGRGQGLAQQLMQISIETALKTWPEAGIQIGAQEYLSHFYQGLNFVVNSEVYLEDGIPHLDMLFQRPQHNDRLY
ncbi:GNAT family N-acetyltransferase [Shewanella sp. SR44-3]|uniref:GNAT family N-acetyltransferase n=1 Tax=Shewanella sp. SR44-3 TaxID=2760936 RepID=UPI0015FB2877|nr:GNAT family N-acetyltransferase [Shewanella sp. SR44-3]MBB1269018.1 GNAT family N-acetyltransferase [Shewanella sp. SR44-3]